MVEKFIKSTNIPNVTIITERKIIASLGDLSGHPKVHALGNIPLNEIESRISDQPKTDAIISLCLERYASRLKENSITKPTEIARIAAKLDVPKFIIATPMQTFVNPERLEPSLIGEFNVHEHCPDATTVRSDLLYRRSPQLEFLGT